MRQSFKDLCVLAAIAVYFVVLFRASVVKHKVVDMSHAEQITANEFEATHK